MFDQDMNNRLIIVGALLISRFSCMMLDAQETKNNRYVSPDYFGSNAFPIPDMLDGSVKDKLCVEVAGDYYWGHYKDNTKTIYARIFIPLFSDRVNLTLWYQLLEFYKVSSDWKQHCGVDGFRGGHEWGDIYVSTDIQLLKESKSKPGVTIRAALKSASGGSYRKARFYDCPGYFFDASIGKVFRKVKVAASGGFLCWQTDNGCQNDAVMFSSLFEYGLNYHIGFICNGYLGWQRNGDCPVNVKLYAEKPMGNLTPFLNIQVGLHNYPYTLLRIGLRYECVLW